MYIHHTHRDCLRTFLWQRRRRVAVNEKFYCGCIDAYIGVCVLVYTNVLNIKLNARVHWSGSWKMRRCSAAAKFNLLFVFSIFFYFLKAKQSVCFHRTMPPKTNRVARRHNMRYVRRQLDFFHNFQYAFNGCE